MIAPIIFVKMAQLVLMGLIVTLVNVLHNLQASFALKMSMNVHFDLYVKMGPLVLILMVAIIVSVSTAGQVATVLKI